MPIERNVTVTGSPTSLPPVANFTYSCVENVCSFDGRSSTDETIPTLTYSWNFGNGSGSGPVPIRTYTSPGTFTVILTVRDENGLSGVTSQIGHDRRAGRQPAAGPGDQPAGVHGADVQLLQRELDRPEHGRFVQPTLELR